MSEKAALITGCYGQDGSYLAEQMSKRGYDIHGICRKELSENSVKVRDELRAEGIRIFEHCESLYKLNEIDNLISELKPDLIFHMAAIHHSSEHSSADDLLRENNLFQCNINATANILCSCACHSPDTHIVAAGSCLAFDASDTDSQDEKTPFKSNSMYGLAKITEASLIAYYRGKGLHASCAILYNHESHRRGGSFVTKKIADGLINIKNGTQKTLKLGDITIRKDWGFAGDYTEGMYLMANAEEPDDYILSTGSLHSIEEYISECAEIIGLCDYKDCIESGSVFMSRKIKGQLKGNPTKAESRLGWKRKYSFKAMVEEMIKRRD